MRVNAGVEVEEAGLGDRNAKSKCTIYRDTAECLLPSVRS